MDIFIKLVEKLQKNTGISFWEIPVANSGPVKNNRKKMVVERGGLYFMFLRPPSKKFLDLLLNPFVHA